MAAMKITVLWEVMLPVLVLPLPTPVPLLPSSGHPSTLIMEGTGSPKTLVTLNDLNDGIMTAKQALDKEHMPSVMSFFFKST
jgi:hypothetical protein